MSMELEAVAGVLGIAKPGRATSPLELVERIEQGLPVAALERVARAIAPANAEFRYAIVPRPTLARRKKQPGKRLTADESERLARLAKVWAFAREVWGSDEAARDFLFRAHMMLGGRRPIDMARGTEVGAKLVEGILGGLKYGTAV